MPDESVKKTIIVALGVCISCSVLVSAVAVSLSDIQGTNRRLDRIKNILLAGNLNMENADINTLYDEKVLPVIIELKSGTQVPEEDYNERLNLESYDIKTMAGDPEYGVGIPAEKDIAGIKRMPRQMVVYFIKEGETTERIVLPVYGKGLWSTMYGFIALGKDLKTVKGITFYEHAETPGLGGEVDNPRWKDSWKGKQAFDGAGNLKIQVIKGRADNSRPESVYQIDGLSGATLTSRGVDNLVRFWLGENGYGPFLKKHVEDLHG